MRRPSGLRPVDGAVAGVALGALVLLVLLGLRDGRDDTSAPAPSTAAPPSVTSTTTGPTSLPTEGESNPQVAPIEVPGAHDPIDELIGRLRVAEEPPRSGYDRDSFEVWTVDAEGCRGRDRVLIDESLVPVVLEPGRCRVVSGSWISIYDGVTTTDPTELEIDHVVALAEAWDSGADAWDDARRSAFANDVDEPGALIAVTSATNQSKADKDPASWRPPNREAWCRFATDWVNVKVKWDLTADRAEVIALTDLLRSGCPDGIPQASTT